MLCAVFVAAKRGGVPCLPYARELIRLGLRGAGARLDQADPLLCRQLLAESFEDADWESRFLTGSWQTLVSRAMPLLTERVVRTFGGSDFRPADLLGAEPIAVYLRLTERDIRRLKPLLRLVWESLINDMVAHYDTVAGARCHPVLLMLDEAARFAVPSLPAHAATVPGRGISLWVAVQSLSQLDGVYGRSDALAQRDSSESRCLESSGTRPRVERAARSLPVDRGTDECLGARLPPPNGPLSSSSCVRAGLPAPRLRAHLRPFPTACGAGLKRGSQD
jgi:hypothetical protein